MNLPRNVGTADRFLRIAGGVVLLALALVGIPAAPLAYVAAIVGVILLATGTVGFCPIYFLLRVSTQRGTIEQQ
jgi:hypothetical protein